jgi:hypothetical protein
MMEFSKHQHAYFQSSAMITIDEPMIQYFGTGGYWINAGLPNYMAIDGCKIQNYCCGKTDIMMALHLVKGPVEEELQLNDDDNKCLHGCKIMSQDLTCIFFSVAKVLCWHWLCWLVFLHG